MPLSRNQRGGVGIVILAGLAAGVIGGSGCESSRVGTSPGSAWLGQQRSNNKPADNRIDSTRVETRDDIVQIVSFWNQPYWLQDIERVRGFKSTVYFVSGYTEKGAFVPGPIDIWVYEMVPTSTGRYERRLVFTHQLNAAEAMAMRVNKLAVGGYYYGFLIQWPIDLYLEGKQVQIQFGYERQADKQVILSSPRTFEVPKPFNFIPPEK